MGLTPHGPRWLSKLERAAIHLVFSEYSKPAERRIFDRTTIRTVPEYVVNDDHWRGSYNSNTITIAIDRHQCADDLDFYSALSNTDILKPGNMDYLNTFIHECTHRWQSIHKKYTDAGPYRPVPYDFSFEELRTLKFIKEHHEFDPLLPSD